MNEATAAQAVRVNWGQRIAAKRRSDGLTQLQLATELGHDPQTISRLERGEMGSLDTYIKVAQRLGIELVGGDAA